MKELFETQNKGKALTGSAIEKIPFEREIGRCSGEMFRCREGFGMVKEIYGAVPYMQRRENMCTPPLNLLTMQILYLKLHVHVVAPISCSHIDSCNGRYVKMQYQTLHLNFVIN